MTTKTQERPASAPAKTMKAVRIHAYGGPDQLRYEDVERPRPGPGEALVRVVATSVNPVDWKIREGHFKGGHQLPLVLGWDFSGVVQESHAQGALWNAGDEVYTRPNVFRNGAYAAYIVVKNEELAPKPTSIDHVKAAAIPLAGLTAWQALFDHGQLMAGEKVLIHGGAGGVGGYAIQLAKWRGAHVLTTASAKNQEYVKSLGADHAIDYHAQRFEDIAMDVDLVIDTIGGETQDRSFEILGEGGRLISTVQKPDEEKLKARGIRGAVFMAATRPDQLLHLGTLVDQGKIRSLAETVLTLAEARKAQEISQSGHTRGKIVMKVD